jgi:hypothetical protein
MPGPRPREPDAVVRVAAVGEVGDDDDVVSWTAGIPTVKGEYLSGLVDLMDVDERAAEARVVCR